MPISQHCYAREYALEELFLPRSNSTPGISVPADKLRHAVMQFCQYHPWVGMIRNER